MPSLSTHEDTSSQFAKREKIAAPLVKACKAIGTFFAVTGPRWDPFRGDANSYYSITPIPTPISTIFVQNEECSRTTRGGRPRIFDMKEKFTRPGIIWQVPPLNKHHPQSAMASHTHPNSSPHGPPLPTRTSSSFSLTTKK
jgi:hypothetical protein